MCYCLCLAILAQAICTLALARFALSLVAVVMVEVVEVVLLPMISKKLMPVAIMAESLLRALAGMRLALFAALFMVMAPLRRRAWACVLIMLFRYVHFLLIEFAGLSVLGGSSRTWTWTVRCSWTWTWWPPSRCLSLELDASPPAGCLRSMLPADLLAVGSLLAVGASIVEF